MPISGLFTTVSHPGFTWLGATLHVDNSAADRYNAGCILPRFFVMFL
jgi:hypothetical protein